MQDIRKWDNKPTQIDLSVATKLVELITKLLSFREYQTILGETTRPEQEYRDLTEIALNCAREVLTFLIGEILSFRETHTKAPKAESLFLDFTPNEKITSIDEDGEYYLVEHEVGLSNFILETSVNFYTNLLTNIQTLNNLRILIHKLGQLQPCNTYPLKPIKPELISLVNKLEQFLKLNWCKEKLINQGIRSQFKKTIKESRKIILLTIPLPLNIIQEEVVRQVTRAPSNHTGKWHDSNSVANHPSQSKEYNNPASRFTRRRRSRRKKRPTINEQVQFQISNGLNQISSPKLQQGPKHYQTQRKCYHCGDEGHLRNQCPALKQQIWQQKQQMELLESAASPVCYNCREIGHKSFECPLRKTGQNHPNLPGPLTKNRENNKYEL